MFATSCRPSRSAPHLSISFDGAAELTSNINIGAGKDLSIRELAELVCEVTGFRGRLDFDASKPDGTPRKLMDSGRLFAMGWRPKTSLSEGLRKTYVWYREHIDR